MGTTAIYAKVDVTALAPWPAVAWGCGMSARRLRSALADYLAVRRWLGFELARHGLLLETDDQI